MINELQELIKKQAEIEKAISDALNRTFTDKAKEVNPETTEIGADCFTVSLSTMLEHNSIMSPEFYSFHSQWEKISEVWNGPGSISKKIEKLKQIAEKGKINTSSGTFLLHPTVRQDLTKILED